MKIRIATLEDINAIEALMKCSMKILGKGYYSNVQIDSCCQFVCVPDRQLIEDQTFFVAILDDSNIVGCGGWSFRSKICAGPKEATKESSRLNPAIDAARIRAMFVDPSYTGMGIGF